MGRRLRFRPGSFYRVDDRTGFATRAERTRMQWDGEIVDTRVWEPRQPQDFVRGTYDNQTVPNPRGQNPDGIYPISQFDGPLYYDLAQDAPPQSYSIVLVSVAGMSVGDYIGIMMDNGSLFLTTIAGGSPLLDSSGNALTDSNGNILYDGVGFGIGVGNGYLAYITGRLPLNASPGNLVVDYRTIL